jgi:hypothetical protein
MRRLRVRRSPRAQNKTGEEVPHVSVSTSGNAFAASSGDALSGYRGAELGASAGSRIVRVERTGDAIASASHTVAISGYVSQMTVSVPSPRPLHWPIRLGSVPVLASAFQNRSAVRERIEQAGVGHTTVVLAQVLSGGGGVGKTQLAAAYTHHALEVVP